MTTTRKASGGVAFRVARQPAPPAPRWHPRRLLAAAVLAWIGALLAIHTIARILP